MIHLPEAITSCTSLPRVVDTNPRTVKVANPPMKLVEQLIKETVIASLRIK